MGFILPFDTRNWADVTFFPFPTFADSCWFFLDIFQILNMLGFAAGFASVGAAAAGFGSAIFKNRGCN